MWATWISTAAIRLARRLACRAANAEWAIRVPVCEPCGDDDFYNCSQIKLKKKTFSICIDNWLTSTRRRRTARWGDSLTTDELDTCEPMLDRRSSCATFATALVSNNDIGTPFRSSTICFHVNINALRRCSSRETGRVDAVTAWYSAL